MKRKLLMPVLSLVVLVGVGTWLLFTPDSPDQSRAVLIGVLIVWATQFVVFAHGLRRGYQMRRALLDGLGSLAERDYQVHLAVIDVPFVDQIAVQFNRLADRLRDEHLEVYQAKLMLETLVQSVPAAILVLDDYERVLIGNYAAAELLGPATRVAGARFAEVVATAPEPLREALSQREDTLLTVEMADEPETFHLSQRYLAFNSREYRVLMVVRLTERLRRKEVAIWKKVIRVVSHEFNNSLAPMQSLLRSGRTILDKPEHAHRLREVLETLEERVEHLESFLAGYARFARIPEPARQRLDWAELLAGLQRLVSFRIVDELPTTPGYGDPVQLQQVLINLLKNAEEAGSAPEDIEVTVRGTADGGAHVQIADRGAGMSDDVCEFALIPFYSTKQRGSGLGLAISREIVEGHGGRLRLARREGGGAVVSLTLPPWRGVEADGPVMQVASGADFGADSG